MLRRQGLLDSTKNACERCGWNKSYCDRHRLKHGAKYTKENVIILCPNCHRIEHQKSNYAKVL